MSKHNDPTAIDRPTNEPSTEIVQTRVRCDHDAEITTLTDALTEARAEIVRLRAALESVVAALEPLTDRGNGDQLIAADDALLQARSALEGA